MVFKKNIVVGVSVNPEVGLEVAQIDFATRTVLKYGKRSFEYDNIQKDIADLDIFQETLYDLLVELDIPKGSEIVLNLPANCFNVIDYPASMDNEQITNAIEETLSELPLFQHAEPCISHVKLPNSTIQMSKIVYTATQKTTLIELAMQIKKLGYKLLTVDTSINSILNGLTYNQMVDVSPEVSWVLLVIDNCSCKILSMQGMNYVDCFEEPVSIGEVLGDAENYSTVANAVNPIIKNLPAQRLFVVSKTNIISAQILAEKLIYNEQIIHLDSNVYAKRPLMPTSEFINEEEARTITIEVIGAAINRDFSPYTPSHLNLFNESLGDIYLNEQPLVIGGFVLSLQNMIALSVIIGISLIILIVAAFIYAKTHIATKTSELNSINKQIKNAEKYLEENKNISAEMFDEGDEVRIGIGHNKNIYMYYTVVGTEIPQKLWLTNLILGEKTVITGQADNLESVYSFYKNVKDYNPETGIKLQKLSLATNASGEVFANGESLDSEAILTSLNADFYEFVISDVEKYEKLLEDAFPSSKTENSVKTKNKSKTKSKSKSVPELEPLE